MSDRYQAQESHPQDWAGGAAAETERKFELIREELEKSGIPFIRANALAERIYGALKEQGLL